MHFNCDQKHAITLASKVKLLLLDADGVLTDGKLYFSNSGEEMKAFHTLDGHGIKMLMGAGIDVGIITGRTSSLLEKRAGELGISLLFQGREDKLNVLEEIRHSRQIDAENIAYAGDDLPDLPVLQSVAMSFSVPQGHDEIKNRVDAVTSSAGGAGAVREITDFLLQAQGQYPDLPPA